MRFALSTSNTARALCKTHHVATSRLLSSAANDSMKNVAEQARGAARSLGATSHATRQSIIRKWADALVQPDNMTAIMAANNTVRYIIYA